MANRRTERTGGIWCPAALLVGLMALAAFAQQPPPLPAPRPAAQPQAGAPPGPGTGASGPIPEMRKGRRDPFRSLLVRPDDLAAAQALPPGKRGLMVGQIRLDGIVVTPTSRIAVVSVPNRNRAYFLRELDELFNGYVAEIHEDSVIFKERSIDAFGKSYEREVVKQISAPSGATR